MEGRAKANAIRSVIVVFGSLAFGYLTFRIGFKPFLDKAQDFESLQQSSPSSSSSSLEEQSSDYRS